MEIAFYTDSYLPTRDGVAAITSGLAREMTDLGHRVRVYTPNPVTGGPTRQTEIDGIPVTQVRSVAVPLYGQYRWSIFPFGLIRELYGGRQADVIHLHSPGPIGSMGFLASRRYKRPLVGTFHTNIRDMRSAVPSKFLVPFFFRVAWWYNLGTYWRCDVTTTPSEAARDALVSSARKPFRHPVEVIPNGIDVARFHPGLSVPDWRVRCGLPDAPLVTYLGRLTIDKGVHRFLDALAEAGTRTDLVGIVGGSGPEEGAVRRRLQEDPRLAGRVRYVGPVTEEEKPALLAESDLFVLPSTSDTSSVALLEAMACGTMVVAPDRGGASEVVQDGVTGRRVSMLEAGPLAAAIQQLLDRPQERREIGAAAADTVRRTASLEMMARRFISLYGVVLRERGFRDGRPAV